MKKLANFLFEIGTLRRVKRSHIQNLGQTEDSVLDHSFRVAVIGYFLAKLEKADADKVLKMCLFHDLGEARTGDQNWIHKRYVTVDHKQVAFDQFGGLPDEKELLKLIKEYYLRESKESIIAKDADILEQILQLREYEHLGNREAKNWLKNGDLKTRTAKKLRKVLKRTQPHDWWWGK